MKLLEVGLDIFVFPDRVEINETQVKRPKATPVRDWIEFWERIREKGR